MDPRDHAHQLIDRLPKPQLTALVGLLESMVETNLSNAEWDDEPDTESERVAVAEAKASLHQNGGISHADAMLRLKLS